MVNKPFKGAGEILIRERLTGLAFDEFGNSSAFQVGINESKETQKDYRTVQGGNVASISTIDDVTGTITGLSYQADTLAIALRALVAKLDDTPVVDEPVTLVTGKHIKLNRIPNMGETFTLNDGTADLTAGTDFIVQGSMIKLTGYSVATGDSIAGTVSYTPKTQYKMKGLSSDTKEYEIYFNGYNLADNDKPVILNIWRAKFSAATALDLITESFGELPIEFEVLADENAVDPDNRFFEMNMAE